MTDTEIKILKKLLKKSPCSVEEFGIKSLEVANAAIADLYAADIVGFAPGDKYQLGNRNKAMHYVAEHKAKVRRFWFDRIVAIVTLGATLYGLWLQTK